MPIGIYKRITPPWNKGIKTGLRSLEVIEKIRLATLGERNPHWKGGKPKCKCGKIIFYGKKNCRNCKRATPITHRKMSESHRGLNFWTKGKVMSEKTKRKISESTKGDKNHQWLKNRNELKRYGNTNKDRRSSAYNAWRREVWLRDKYKCKIDNEDCCGRLEAHHILGYTDHPELRYDINNGITLCHFHHPRKRKEESKLSPYFQSLVAEMN